MECKTTLNQLTYINIKNTQKTIKLWFILYQNKIQKDILGKKKDIFKHLLYLII